METIFISIVTSVIVFAISELLKQMWLEPLQNYKKLKQKVACYLTYYAHYYVNPIDSSNMNQDLKNEYLVASDNLRKMSSEIDGFIETLYFIKFGIPSKKDLREASRSLIALSNILFSNNQTSKHQSYDTQKYTNTIRQKLKLYSQGEADEV